MKEKIVAACPNIQIGGMPGSSSVEHLVTLKTWMLMKEERKDNGNFQTFDIEKFFDKESLLDTMYSTHCTQRPRSVTKSIGSGIN